MKPEIRKKISRTLTGVPKTPEHAAAIAAGKKGIDTSTPESRERTRQKLLGRKQSEETKAKKSAAMKGRPQRPEVVAARAKAMTGRKRSAEARENIRAARLAYLARERGLDA